MDKENNDIMTADNTSYDADAAELLKDLEDDEDDEDYAGYEPESAPAQAQSLVNILTSTNNLESIMASSAPAAPAASEALASPDDLEPSPSDDLSNHDEALKTEPLLSPVAPAPASDTPAPAASTSSAPAAPAYEPLKRDEPAPAAPAPEVKSAPAASKPDPISASVAPDEKSTSDSIRPAPQMVKKSIKPFETKFKKSDDDDKSAAPKDTIKDEKPVVDAELSDRTPAASANAPISASSARRPPVPKPPMPSTSATASARTLRDGENVYTQEQLNDLLPGGKFDEARDLAALKFADNNWYAQIFNEDFFRTVPASSPRQTKREAKFIIDRLGIETGARVLDLCCGFGRHTIELASKGFDMAGLDLSMVMLKKALSDAQAKNQAIKFVHGDMRKLTFKAIFDAIYNVQTSFGYFDDLSNFKVLQGIFNALKPGGVFLIETINRDFLVNDLPLRLWWKGKECMLLEEIDLEPLSGILKVQRSFVFDDNTRAPWEQKIQIRLYSASEMRALLMRAGFKVVELSGDYSLPGAYFGATSPRNIFVAEKAVK